MGFLLVFVGMQVKVFGDTTNLANNQIINYRRDPTDKRHVLIRIALGAYLELWMDILYSIIEI
jgi:hypothetical protein